MFLTECRICKSKKIDDVVDLGSHPPADTFIPKEYVYSTLPSYPLRLAKCGNCNHVFTKYYVTPEERYQKYEYSYDSSNSKVAESHFNSFANSVIASSNISKNSLVVDIGGNVGTLLSKFKDHGFNNILNIEPSENISKIAEKNGIKTINKFFDQSILDIKKEGLVDCVLSSNVLNHTDDINSVLKDTKEILSEEGVLVFEVPYLYDLVEQVAFDTIYHEHVHYFSVKALKYLMGSHGLTITKIMNITYMCGSLRVFVQKDSPSTVEAENVMKLIAKEDESNLFANSKYEAFMANIRTMKVNLNSQIYNIVKDGGKVVGVGAATKGNTLLNYFKLDQDAISYLTDSSILKIGKIAPGSMIPILDDSDIDSDVTHLLILPWNLAEYLKSKLTHLGKEFIIPEITEKYTIKGDDL